MTFQSENKSGPAKMILVSASSSSGKSYTFRKLSNDECFASVHVFEMDSLGYMKKNKLDQRLPIAWRKFDQWYENSKQDNLLDELCSNIRSSERENQLIKLKLVELMSSPDQVITVLPYLLRHSAESIRFVELLEEYSRKRIVHISIIPNLTRYLLNLIQRKKSFSFDYLNANLAERKLLMSKQSCFDDVIYVPLWTIDEDFSLDIFKKYIE